MPGGVPAAALEAARGTLGAAAKVAGDLPAHQAAALLSAAREAFAQAFEVTALACAGLALVAASATVLLLKGAGTEREVVAV